MKNAFLKEAKTVERGTKSMIRDTVQQPGEHREKQFVETEAKGRDTHPEGKGVGVPPMRKSALKRQSGHLCRSFLPDLGLYACSVASVVSVFL